MDFSMARGKNKNKKLEKNFVYEEKNFSEKKLHELMLFCVSFRKTAFENLFEISEVE
jgi:hypothetical protein